MRVPLTPHERDRFRQRVHELVNANRSPLLLLDELCAEAPMMASHLPLRLRFIISERLRDLADQVERHGPDT
jgi:hypothetical protein